MSDPRRAPNAYRFLLRCLPKDLTRRFGRDMEDVFVHRMTEAGSSVQGRAWVWIRAVVDIGVQAIATRTATHERTGTPGLGPWVQDLQYAARSLRNAPVFTVAALITLALGIGASTATFSVFHAVLLKSLPYEEPDRLVVVWPEVNANKAMAVMAEERMQTLDGVSGLSQWTLTLTGVGDPTELTGMRVSPGHFDLLGVRPTLGRGFNPNEGLPGEAGVVILSHDFWVRAFGADPSVVGRTVDMGGADYQSRVVIGVMAPGVTGVWQATDVWIPLEGDPALTLEEDDTWYVNTRIARLTNGATLEQANTEVLEYAAEVQRRLPGHFDEEQARSATVRSVRDYNAGDVGGVIRVALGAVSLVLLIACANVTNLLLARGDSRAPELAIRSALGAGRGRVARMLLAETCLLGFAGGTLGIATAFGLVRLLGAQAPAGFPGADSITMSLPVLAYAIGITATSTIISGLMPAIRASRIDGTGSLGGSGRGTASKTRGGLSSLLVGTQIALAVVVTVGSGLMLRSLTALLAIDPGVDGTGVLTFKPNPPAGRYPDGTAFRDYYRRVTERLAAMPGVESVGAIHILPGTANNWSFPTFPEGVSVPDGATIPSVNFRAVRGDYFQTVRMPLSAGRFISDDDRGDTEPVALVNQAFVERYWPGDDPLGRTLSLFSANGTAYRVVGVVSDVRQHARAEEPRPEMYFSHEQVPWDQMTLWLMVRVRSGEPLAASASVRDAVWSVDPSVPISGMDDMGEVLGQSTRTTRFITLLLAAFGVMALTLGSIGVFGVAAYTSGRRQPEFGVRLALGSSRSGVLLSAARGSIRPVTAGLAVGLVCAFSSSDLLSSVLYGVEPTDPVTFVLVTLILGGIATLATLIPAWRASRVDPVRVLNGN